MVASIILLRNCIDYVQCGLLHRHLFLCLKDQVMISILGRWMSPVLVVALLALIIVGFWQAPSLSASTVTANNAFVNGFLTGYQTMDLFAAFFFSALIFTQIKNSLPHGTSDREVLKYAVLPSIIGSTMLAFVYLGFVYLGSHYAPHIHDVEPEMMLPSIVMLLIGNYATIIIAAAMILSCLTTAVALNNIYARFLCTSLKLKDSFFPVNSIWHHFHLFHYFITRFSRHRVIFGAGTGDFLSGTHSSNYYEHSTSQSSPREDGHVLDD